MIKIIRLQSGEDIIADYTEDEENAMLSDPLHMIVKRTVEGPVMVLLPWLPVELIKENLATIYLADILTTVDPKDEMIDYYKTAIEKMKLKNFVNKEFDNYEDGDEEDYETEHEQYYSDVLKNTKIGTVH